MEHKVGKTLISLIKGDITHCRVDAIVNAANTDLIQLGQAFKFAGPVATAAGVAFAEQAAILGILGSSGIQASLAGTSLRGAIARLLSPSKEATTILDELGVKALDSTGNLRSMADIVDDLNAAGVSATAILEIFGLRAGPGMAVLLAEGGAAIRQFTADLDAAGGTSKRVAEVSLDTLQGDLTLTTSAAEGTSLSIGKALSPAIRTLTGALRPAIRFVGMLVTRFPVVTAVVIGASVVIGALGITLVGIAFILPGLVILFPALAGGISLAAIASGALAFALSPITLIILGITAAVVAGIVVWRLWGSGLGWVSDRLASLLDLAKQVANAFIRFSPLTQLLRLTPLGGGIGRLPQFGMGGIQSVGGPAIVGDRGPEVVSMPAGAQVTPVVNNSTSFNVQANYTNRQEPQGVRLDLEALAMMTRA